MDDSSQGEVKIGCDKEGMGGKYCKG